MSDDESVSSNNSVNDLSNKRFYCEDCERSFATRYTLQRHNKFFHGESEEEEDAMSDVEENESDQSAEEDEMSTQETSSDEKEETSSDEEDEMSTNETSSDEDEEEEEQEEVTVTAMFRKLLCKAIDKDFDQTMTRVKDYKSEGISEKEATKRALLESDALKKSLIHMYTQNVFDIEEQRRDPLFKAIMKKAKEFMDIDELNQSEAIAAAVKFRKQAIYDMINLI